jgi:hypothetical protein
MQPHNDMMFKMLENESPVFHVSKILFNRIGNVNFINRELYIGISGERKYQPVISVVTGVVGITNKKSENEKRIS